MSVAGNAASFAGGGVYQGTLYGCRLSSNSSGTLGGGLSESTAWRCLVVSNPAPYGGGIYKGRPNNRLISANTAGAGGATRRGTLNDCTLAGNSATNSAGGADLSALNNCIAYYNDADDAGMNQWREWICGTVPTNPVSLLKMLAASNSAAGLTINWHSASGRLYSLQRDINLLVQPGFVSLRSNSIGQAGTISCTGMTASDPGPSFYRVGVYP